MDLSRKSTLDQPPDAKLWELSVVKVNADSHYGIAPDGRRSSNRKAAEEARRVGGSAAFSATAAVSSAAATWTSDRPRAQHTAAAAVSSATGTAPSTPLAAHLASHNLEPTSRDLARTREVLLALQQDEKDCEPFVGGTAGGATANERLAWPLPQPSFKQEDDVRSALNAAGYQQSFGSDTILPPVGCYKWMHAKWDSTCASLLTDGKCCRIDFVIGVPNGFIFLEADGRLARCAKGRPGGRTRPQLSRLTRSE